PSMDKLLAALTEKQTYARNLLVNYRQKLVPVAVDDFGLFYIENGVVRGLTFGQEAYFPEQNLDELELMLDPAVFYRANRQTILNHGAITAIESYFNSRLLISTKPVIAEDILVSKAKAREFKNWIKGAGS
ncbi:MAG: LytTR family DNA-binding domain-containing protein, partial [Bacteroidota bacterium]